MFLLAAQWKGNFVRKLIFAASMILLSIMRPPDLGYFMGYKISESYYKNARDKRQAIKDILEINDFDKFLKQSKYHLKFAKNQ
jgi:hypothetical protein